MNGLFAVLIAFVTAALQVIFGHPKTLPNKPVEIENKTATKSSEVEKEATPSVKVDDRSKKLDIEEEKSEIPEPKPPVQVNTTNINMNDFRYANSTIVSQGDGKLSLQSSDDPGTITDWYKQKIVAMGANVKSIVTTKTNDNVLNSLSGSTGKASIQVKISKPSGTNTVSIDVTVSSS